MALPSILQARNDILCLFFAARFHEKLANTRRKRTRINWNAHTVNQPRMHVKELENRRGQVKLRRKNWMYTLAEDYATLQIWFSPGIKTELVETETLLQSDYFGCTGFEYSPDERRNINTNCATIDSFHSLSTLLFCDIIIRNCMSSAV